MFRAISDYFFGGATEEPQSPLETQEVNDWLVVNMADRPQDDIVMIESTKPDPMSDSEYEDILDAVSCLMRSVEESEPEPELEPSDGESTVESSDCEEEEEVEEEENYSKREVFPVPSQDSAARRVYVANLLGDPNFVETVKRMTDFWSRLDLAESLVYRRCQLTEQEVVQHYEIVPYDKGTKFVFPVKCEDFAHAQELMEEEDEDEYMTMVNELSHPEVHFVQCKAEEDVPNNRFVLPRRYARMSSYLDASLKVDYSALHKAEIQQRIHEVEREQKLKKYKSEKVINRGQLNRQNKNYLFQSSCKKNRRRDLQRSHSGANNNRKCSC